MPTLDAVTAFKRTMHSKGNLRLGLAIARKVTPPDLYGAIVRELGRNDLYRGAFAIEGFPSTFNVWKKRPSLPEVDKEREFVWAAAVVSLFSEKLAVFVQSRERFESQFFGGDLECAEATLLEIEKESGVSIWLLQNRLLLLQAKYGLAEHKSYLESIISIDGISPFPAFLGFYLSNRAEPNMSYSAYLDEIRPLLADTSDLRDYFRYHIAPFSMTLIEDTANPIVWDERQPIIDRYQVLIAMLALEFSRDPNNKSVRLAIKMLENIPDTRTRPMMSLIKGEAVVTRTVCLDIADHYTQGNYRQALDMARSSFARHSDVAELAARSIAHLGLPRPEAQKDFSESSIFDQVTYAMADMLMLADAYEAAHQSLRKLAMIVGAHPLAFHITSFLEREGRPPRSGEIDESDFLSASFGSLDNPWIRPILQELLPDLNWQVTSETLEQSPALELQNSLTASYDEAQCRIASISMPTSRRELYLAHVALKSSNTTVAAEKYSKLMQSGAALHEVFARKGLFEAYIAEGKISECIALITAHYLEKNQSYRLYPIKIITDKALREISLDVGDLLVLIYIASRLVNSSYERDVSDAAERFLELSGTQYPSALPGLHKPSRRLVFLLRNVFVQRVLDDFLVFDNVSDVEAERIKICQALIDIDPQNAELYAVEIRSITREAEIVTLLQRVDESKVYVSEDGIKDVVAPRLRDAFSRWQAIKPTPDITGQADKISRRLGELVGDKMPDMSKIRLPHSERETVFSDIYQYFASEFALNPAFGLDTHLSTSIRHGAFEGHLRRAMAEENLLSLSTKGGGEYLPNQYWITRLGLPLLEAMQVDKALARFSQRVDETIKSFRNERLQVRTTDSKSSGLFDFFEDTDDLIVFMRTIIPTLTYEEFLERLFTRAWSSTTESMAAVQRELRGSLRARINTAFETLLSALSNLERERVSPLIDAVISARTEFQLAIERVCLWFQRASALYHEPYELEMALSVALREVENCYVRQTITPSLSVDLPYRLKGETFDRIIEILFILLQNVIRHSGFDGKQPGVAISAIDNNGVLEVSVSNELSCDVDLGERRVIAHGAREMYAHDTAMKKARTEGGSGLSKIWRILEFDLKVLHYLQLNVGDDQKFTATLQIDSDGIREC